MVRGEQRRIAFGLRRGRVADATDGQATGRRQRHRSLGSVPNVSTLPHDVQG